MVLHQNLLSNIYVVNQNYNPGYSAGTGISSGVIMYGSSSGMMSGFSVGISGFSGSTGSIISGIIIGAGISDDVGCFALIKLKVCGRKASRLIDFVTPFYIIYRMGFYFIAV